MRWPSALLALAAGCHWFDLPPRPVPRAKLPDEPAWQDHLRAHGVRLAVAPMTRRVPLRYRWTCELSYDLRLIAERDELSDGARENLSPREERWMDLHLAPARDEVDIALEQLRPPGVSALLGHLWDEGFSATLPVDARGLLPGGAPDWEQRGLGLFFPRLATEEGALRWTEDAPSPFSLPLAEWGPVSRSGEAWVDSLFTWRKEPVALLHVVWREERSSLAVAGAPLWTAREQGHAIYVWLPKRGWPLFSDVFASMELESFSLDRPQYRERRFWSGRAALSSSCEGPVLAPSGG